MEITSLSDGCLEFDLCNFYPSIPTEKWRPYEDVLTADRRLNFNVGSFLVRSDGRTILVDTGLGPEPAFGRETARGELLDDLKAKGIRPEDIDMVVMTHLHRDHVGWNLVSQGDEYLPTFPRARYWMSVADWEFFAGPRTWSCFPRQRDACCPSRAWACWSSWRGSTR